MIVISGATGRLGGLVLDRLLELVPAQDIGVSVRDVQKAAGIAERGVRVRAGDFTDPRTLDLAFEGADQVLLVSPFLMGGAAEASRAAIDAAVRAGASRVLYTSHQAASGDSLFGAQPEHAAVEAYLAGQGMAFTALRHGYYASTLESYVPEAVATGELRVPEDGPFSWTAHEDLAEVDVIALTRPGALDGVTPALTAPQLLDFADVAGVLSELTGRSIERVVVHDEEWKASRIARGVPAPAAEFVLGMFQAARRGEFAHTDPALEDLLGRPSVAVRTVLERTSASWSA